MACLAIFLWILRILLSLVLGLVILVAFLAWMVVVALQGVLDYRVYADALAEQDAYERLYSEVFPAVSPDNPIRAGMEQVPGVPYDDQVLLLRRIVPPDYLQAQTESLLRGASRYLTRKEERLELYLELDEPLDRTSPVLVDYLEVRIDGLEVVEPANFLEVLAEGRFAEELTESLRLLLVERQLPNRIPSIAFIPDLLRPLAFDLVLGRLPELLPVDSDVRSELERVGPQLREHFVAGDTLEFMKLLTRSIVGPAIEKAIAFVKSELELDRSGRFDVTAAVAEGAGYSDVAELQREIDSSWVGFYQNVNRARTLLIVVVIAGTIFMGLLYLPHVTHCLRWPGLALLLIGGLGFFLGMVIQANLSDAVANMSRELLVSDIGSSSPAALLVSDTLQAVVDGLLEDLGTPGLWLALAGAALFAGSFGWSYWQRSRQREMAADGATGTVIGTGTPGLDATGLDTMEPGEIGPDTMARETTGPDTPGPDTGAGDESEPGPEPAPGAGPAGS